MSISTPPAGQSYTILRIKRKRNEEPLEALVVESRIRKKRSRKGVGLFQYAETVENDAWDDAARQKDMQDKILRLAQENALKADSKEGPQILEVPPSPVSRISRDESSRRYTIIDTEEPKIPSRRYPTAPPKVYSSKELEERKNARDFKMYDAVPAGATPMVQDDPSEMDKFLPMLNDYLKIHDIDPNDSTSATLKKSSASHTNGQIVAPIVVVDDDDYVWDVFYHRPATMSEWNAVANVGTVTGLPSSLGDGYDSASDSDEEVDEADEDSNAEEYYKNDYPEDECSSDEFHEDSEYEDAMDNADDSDF